jgi:hypothetical protein
MRRRKFITLLGGSAALPIAASARQRRCFGLSIPYSTMLRADEGIECTGAAVLKSQLGKG